MINWYDALMVVVIGVHVLIGMRRGAAAIAATAGFVAIWILVTPTVRQDPLTGIALAAGAGILLGLLARLVGNALEAGESTKLILGGLAGLGAGLVLVVATTLSLPGDIGLDDLGRAVYVYPATYVDPGLRLVVDRSLTFGYSYRTLALCNQGPFEFFFADQIARGRTFFATDACPR